MVSRAPLAELERGKASKGWDIPWYSSFGTDFNYDFGVTIDESVAPGEYNFRTRAESEAMGRTSSPQTSPSRCRAGAASSKPAGACSTPTPSTPVAWSPPAAPTTFSTSPLGRQEELCTMPPLTASEASRALVMSQLLVSPGSAERRAAGVAQ
jgi:predicted dithiol-disulfide oxidoreductase (DUF899 family)